jgi:DNA-binding GntR family transcriptional regulator
VTVQGREVVGRELLADRVYDRLMLDLVDGRLEAGAPVSIDALSRELGVSQTPVREALARIEWTGLVTRIALKGYRVAPPFTPDDLRQLFEARRVIEPATASAAAGRRTPELCDGLQRDLDDLATAPRGPSFADFRRYWEADERFHRRIAEHSGNRYLLRSYSALGGQVQRYRLFVGHGVTDAEPTLHEHGSILAAIRAGEPALARGSMDRHIANVWERARREGAAGR